MTYNSTCTVRCVSRCGRDREDWLCCAVLFCAGMCAQLDALCYEERVSRLCVAARHAFAVVEERTTMDAMK